jgi:hypothetical protein
MAVPPSFLALCIRPCGYFAADAKHPVFMEAPKNELQPSFKPAAAPPPPVSFQCKDCFQKT